MSQLEREVVRVGHALAKERGVPFLRLFTGGDSLTDDVVRLQVARRVRGRVAATSTEIDAAIQELLT